MPSHLVSSSRLNPSKKPSVCASSERHERSPFIRSPIIRWHLSNGHTHNGKVCVRWIRSVKPVLTSRLSILEGSGFSGMPRFQDATASSSWSLARGQLLGSGSGFAVRKVLRCFCQDNKATSVQRDIILQLKSACPWSKIDIDLVWGTQSTKVISTCPVAGTARLGRVSLVGS